MVITTSLCVNIGSNPIIPTNNDNINLNKGDTIMNVFRIKNNKPNERYIKSTLSYFIDKDREGVTISFEKEYIRIIIIKYYCSVCNALLYLLKNDEIIATQRSLKWLNKYNNITKGDNNEKD